MSCNYHEIDIDSMSANNTGNYYGTQHTDNILGKDHQNLVLSFDNTINDRTDLENFVIVYEPNKRLKACLTIFCFMGLIFLVVFIDNNYR